MIDNSFRDWLSTRVRFLTSLYARFSLSPNHITFLGLAFALLASIFCALSYNLLAIALWWLGRLFDGTDGIYAREIQKSTAFGSYLDILCDMTAYSAMIIGFFFRFPHQPFIWLLILGLYILCITSALAFGSLQTELKLSEQDNRGLRLGAGLAEGGETGIVYTLFLLFPNSIELLSLLWILTLLITVVSRTRLAFHS